MSYSLYMGDRNIGFLWDDEREFIDAHPKVTKPAEASEITPDFEAKGVKNPTQVRHRIRNGPASPQGLGEILKEVHGDLELLERFWYDAMIHDDGRFEFQNIVLPANEDRLRELHTLLGEWIKRAESEHLQVDQQVLNAKLEPLREDIDPEDSEEYLTRLDALAALIRENELRVVLEWINAKPGKKVRQEAHRDSNWRWLASRKLRTMYGLIENDGSWDHCYRLTERGDAVYATLQVLGEPAEGLPESEEERFKEWLSRIEYYRTTA